MLSVITEFAELEALRPEWSELWRNDPRTTPFQSPEWLLPWSRHLFAGGQLWTVTQRERGCLISLLPLFRWGEKLQNLSFLGAGVTDYLDIIGAPIDSIPGDWNDAELDGIRPDSPLLVLGVPEERNVCPSIQLPDTMEALIHRIDPKLAVDIRRSTNRLNSAGEVRLERTADPADLFALHESRWGDRNEPGVLAEDAIQRFHREVASGFDALGILRLYRLLLDSRPIGAIYAFTHDRRAYAYISGFDAAYGKFSPGTVLLARVIEDAINEGVREFDFLRDPEGYKYRWGAIDRVIYRVRLLPG